MIKVLETILVLPAMLLMTGSSDNIQKNVENDAFFDKNIEKIDLKTDFQSENVLQKSLNNDLLILRFSRKFSNSEIDDYINNNSLYLEKKDNVFIFRYSKNLSNAQMKYISQKIKEINPKIRLFIDQEGGIINRFEEFTDMDTFPEIFVEDKKLFELYSALSNDLKERINKRFSGRKFFLSMQDIWLIYRSLEFEKEKSNFLEFMAYFRLYLIDRVYSFVLDLDYGNPVISWLYRSFSSNPDEYFEFAQYTSLACKYYGISLYLKHFPGHWDGKIDTHNWILVYEKSNLWYLETNADLFDKVLSYSKSLWVKTWVLVAHISLPNDFKDKFSAILSNADYVLTDDLSMNWYKNYLGKIWTFFSTEEILKLKNIIKVDVWTAKIK